MTLLYKENKTVCVSKKALITDTTFLGTIRFRAVISRLVFRRSDDATILRVENRILSISSHASLSSTQVISGSTPRTSYCRGPSVVLIFLNDLGSVTECPRNSESFITCWNSAAYDKIDSVTYYDVDEMRYFSIVPAIKDLRSVGNRPTHRPVAVWRPLLVFTR